MCNKTLTLETDGSKGFCLVASQATSHIKANYRVHGSKDSDRMYDSLKFYVQCHYVNCP